MKQNVYRGVWAGCSDLTERRKELNKAHEEFQKLLDSGFKLKEARVKRPRIKLEKYKIVMVFGKPMKLTIQEYNDHYAITVQK